MAMNKLGSRFCRTLIFCLIVLSLQLPVAFGAPKWATQTPHGKRNAYAVGLGESATSLYEAKRQSIADAMRVFSEQQNVVIESKFRSLTTEDHRHIEDEVLVKGTSKTLKGLRLVETYVQANRSPYQVWTLMSMPERNPTSRLSAVWRSVLLPGWGQFYQGKTVRGVGFLIAQAGTIAGAYYTQARQLDFEDQALQSSVPTTRKYYYDKADQYHQGNVILVSAAILTYGLNLADVLFLSGNKRDLYYAASVSPDGGIAFTLRLP